MADVVTEHQPVVPTKREEEALILARRRAEAKVPRHRFGIAYLCLAALIGAAVGVTILLVTQDDSSKPTGPAWSAWAPSATGTLGVRQIAREIAPRYHLTDGKQLVGVVAGPMVIPSDNGPIPVSAILIGSGRAGVAQQRIDVSIPEAGVFYQMCGTGQRCAIPGNPTIKRGQLVFREGIELALYTFHYLPQADNVLVFIPPPAGVDTNSPYFHRVLWLPREALTTELSVPLSRALPPGTTTITPDKLPVGQGNAINGLVAGRVFHYEFQQASDNSVFVVLTPLP